MTTQKSIPVEALPIGTIVDFHVGSWMHGTEVEITGIAWNGLDSYLFSFNRGPNVVCESDYATANIACIAKIHKRGKGPVYHVSRPGRSETNSKWTPFYQRKGYVSEHEVERFIWEELSRYGQNGTTFSPAILDAVRNAVHSKKIDFCNWYKTKAVKRWLAKNVNRFRIGAVTYLHYETLLEDYGYSVYGDGLDDEFKESICFQGAIDHVDEHINKILYTSKRYSRKIRGVLNSYWANEFKGQIYRHAYRHGDKTYVLMSDVSESLIPEGYGDYSFESHPVSEKDVIDFFNIEPLDDNTISIKGGRGFIKLLVDPNMLVKPIEDESDPFTGEYDY